MPVIKENTLTEGNNNHWNLVLPAWQYSSDQAEQEKLNTWRVRLALEDERAIGRTLAWWKSPFSRTVK